MRCMTILCVIIVCVSLSGCIQTDTVIRVKPDGSGFVEETVKLSNEMLESMRMLAKGFAQSDTNAEAEAKDKDVVKAEAPDPVQSMMKDAASRETKYGPDVKFVSAVPVKTETMSGYKAIYAFRDINTLRIDQNPDIKVQKPVGNDDAAPKKEEIIRFRFVKGPVSTLTVTMPEPKPKTRKDDRPAEAAEGAEQSKGEAAPADPEMMEMMKKVLRDFSVSLALEIDGAIIKTNATYQDKSKITLIDMNFGKLLDNEEILKKMDAAQPGTMEEMKELAKGLEGLKMEMSSPVEVTFQ